MNVYGLESIFENNRLKTEVVGLSNYTKEKRSAHVNLLLISDELNKDYTVG